MGNGKGKTLLLETKLLRSAIHADRSSFYLVILFLLYPYLYLSAVYLLQKPFPSLPARMLVHRAEDTGGLAHNVFFRKQAPITGVLRRKHIVAGREIVVLQESIFPNQAIAT